MSAGAQRGPARRFGPSSALVIAVALTAGGVLLVSGPQSPPAQPAPANRVSLTAAWPTVERASLSGELSDGTTFVPGHFLDARTAVGTAPDAAGRSLRLVVRNEDGSFRELRSLPEDQATYGSYAASATDLVWVESADGGAPQIWAADLRDTKAPARKLTSDVGGAQFPGYQYDLVVNSGRVFWAALPANPAKTEIRSVPLAGGSVLARTEAGRWSLSAWPWLTDGSDQTSVAKFRNLQTRRDVEVLGSGTELLTCSPAWCRVSVVGEGGISRIDLMRHDGSGRTKVADGAVGTVGSDVALLDRFELLFEPQAGDASATALLVHDVTTNSTVEVSPAVEGAFSRGGVLWWSTDDNDSTVWHTIDLRTV